METRKEKRTQATMKVYKGTTFTSPIFVRLSMNPRESL
ncbi:hypothetical protein COLO4_36897 [Corchorus olitorius]|uniref:Uncharacterized protein n=1 Tax=Corchorus olitorius TaxID=93759 RepID=A0A1R3G4L2_9ROSI|nr:hypothetical protein COLO4_36897 [Corchorus olitorius]